MFLCIVSQIYLKTLFEVYSFKKEKKIAIDIFSCIYLIYV